MKILFNYETVIGSIREFLAKYTVPEGRQLYIVMDNASWNKKAKRLIEDETSSEYADIREKVTLISLPPYSTDLNPIEQVWRITRDEKTHNRYWSSLNSLSRC